MISYVKPQIDFAYVCVLVCVVCEYEWNEHTTKQVYQKGSLSYISLFIEKNVVLNLDYAETKYILFSKYSCISVCTTKETAEMYRVLSV